MANRSVIKRIKLGRGASGILIPPDGSRAFVAMTGEDAIAVVDLKTLTETARLKTGRGPDGMAWIAAKALTSLRVTVRPAVMERF